MRSLRKRSKKREDGGRKIEFPEPSPEEKVTRTAVIKGKEPRSSYYRCVLLEESGDRTNEEAFAIDPKNLLKGEQIAETKVKIVFPRGEKSPGKVEAIVS